MQAFCPMIAQLNIRNFILIRELELRFHPGLNILTGETGAGKSILMGALGLLAGERAEGKTLRDPEQKCVLEAWFEGETPGLQALLEEAGIDSEPQTILRREMLPGGKSRAFVNDTPVTLEWLKRIGNLLFDIHGQQDTQMLGTADTQTVVLDLLAGSASLKKEYQHQYQAWKSALRERDELIRRRDQEASEFSYKQFVFSELEEARLRDGEQEELESSLDLIRNSEELKTKLNLALNQLDGEGDLAGQLKMVSGLVDKLSPFSEDFRDLAARLKSSWLEIRDISAGLREQEEKLLFDPEELLAKEERLSQLYTLQKKHRRDSVSALLSYQSQLAGELESWSGLDDAIEKCESEIVRLESQVRAIGSELSAMRKNAAPGIASGLLNLVSDMGMPKAKFELGLDPAEPGPTGCDKVKFLFSANPGLPLSELKNAASGGEFSRLMLAFKCLMAYSSQMPSLIFDEIDTGISGEVAMKVGNIIREMANRHQVLCITHSAQMASRAQAHWFVYKDQSEAETSTSVRRLSEAERLEEIAKMISGSKPGDAAYQAARELIES